MLKYLFDSFDLKGKVIKNRCVVPAMVTNYCENDGSASERYIAYHEARAKGGFGLIITEDYAVNASGRGFSNVAGLWNDDQIAGHSKLPEAVHKHGATILAQIYHSGRQTSKAVIGTDLYAPSAMVCPFSPDIPVELSEAEIIGLIEDFGNCALRAKKCGFDGVEIHGGHGYLIAQFMSSYSNKRTDKYGGSLQNRLRFPTEIIKNVRQKCGEDFIIGFRISADEFIEGGRTLEVTKAIVPILEDSGIDIIHVSAGCYASADTVVPPAYVKPAWIVDMAKEIKDIAKVPVIAVGRINSPEIADSVLRSGKADFVAMGRASLIDPDMPNKAKEGRFEDIRYCIGCNYGCLGVLFSNNAIKCVLNPTLGKEKEYHIPKAENFKKVAIIGAGPAGLEAARVAKEAGHDVVVYEKSNSAGGNFRLAAVPPCKGEISSFISWQVKQLEDLNVEIKYNTEVTSEFIEENPADVIIMATGSSTVIPRITGVELPHVVTANDVLAGKVNVGYRNVVVGGGQVGAELANHLAIQLKNVTLVEMGSEIAADEALAPKWHLLKALENRKVNILVNTTVSEITPNKVILNDGSSLMADTVILAVGYKQENSLSEKLANKGLDIRVVGDAGSIGTVMDATSQGYKAGLNI